LNKSHEIEFGNEKIKIVKCKYCKKRGFERVKIDKQKTEEEKYDNFM